MHLMQAHVPIRGGIEYKRMYLYSMQKYNSFSRRMCLYEVVSDIGACACKCQSTVINNWCKKQFKAAKNGENR